MKLVSLLCAFFISVKGFSQVATYNELYRPRFHYSPKTNWCNDPNGLVYSKGQYHLFYQFNPSGNEWGHMTWAHAISKDLVHWKHLPDAIKEENGIMAFSGSAVSDVKNSTGFGSIRQPPLVAVYTGHQENVNQSQNLAFSIDDGLHWTKFTGNPVLDLKQKDFRDPKVFWYAPKNYWVMAVMLPNDHIVQFYNSVDLKQWNHLSNFGPAGDTSGVWECPDLSLVQVRGTKETAWVLQTSQNAGMQYFVGDFNGVEFENGTTHKIIKPDYGPDYYAAISYNNLPAKQEAVSIGWINNWNYANKIPTYPWKGAMSLPRTLSVEVRNGERKLLQVPINSLEVLREKVMIEKNKDVLGTHPLSFKSNQFEMQFTLTPGEASIAGLRLAADSGKFFEVGYDAQKQVLYADRRNTKSQFNDSMFYKLGRTEIDFSNNNKPVKFRIFYDHSIIEIFINDGEYVLTFQVFVPEKSNKVEVFSLNSASGFAGIKAWKIKSIW